MDKIYLDNAATTQLAPEVVEIINEVNSKYFGNPSSIHQTGQDAKRIIDDARRMVAFFVGCEPTEIVFTSGGSESDNLAIRGVIEVAIPPRPNGHRGTPPVRQAQGLSANRRQEGNFLPHVVTSAVEHHAVLHTVEELEKEGKIEATYLKPNEDGVISADQVRDAIKDNTVLVSLIYVNNETGVVTPIREIGEQIRKINESPTTPNPSSGMRGISRKIYFHTDAVQAAEFFQIAPEYLNVDLLTFTAHKIHGPKGVGLLYIKKGTPIKPQISGGDHEFRLRAGTENTSGIAGLSKAIDLILKERSDTNLNEETALPELMTSNEAKRIIKLRDRLIQGITEKIPDSILNGSQFKRTPNIINISFMNAEGEAILLNLDFMGVAVSSGSACTSRSLAPSHVLSAMGVPPEKAHGTIRFSLSRYTTEEEIDRVLEILPPIIEKLRAMSPFKS